MGYNAKADPPRGELCLKGSVIFKGYFRSPQLTAEALDDDGWLRTGDVAEIAPAGMVKIIDRRKNLFKLSQGEYVSPEKLEGIYSQCLSVSQIFVTGFSTESEPVAIIVPNDLEASVEANEKTIAAELEKFNSNGELLGFEKIKRFSISDVPFTVENDFLTPSFKLRRTQIAEEFADEIQKLYKKN